MQDTTTFVKPCTFAQRFSDGACADYLDLHTDENGIPTDNINDDIHTFNRAFAQVLLFDPGGCLCVPSTGAAMRYTTRHRSAQAMQGSLHEMSDVLTMLSCGAGPHTSGSPRQQGT